MGFKKIVVAGGGVLGSQIAYQSAYCGFDVVILLRSEGSIGRSKPKVEGLHKTYEKVINFMNTPEGKINNNWCNGISSVEDFDVDKCIKENKSALGRISFELDPKKALIDADLVVESIAEIEQDKIDFYTMIKDLMEEKTILVTNTSTMLPSTFEKYTGRSEKYFAFHFATEIWKANVVEIMKHSGTDDKYVKEVTEFAKQIKMIPIPVNGEQPGYVMNSIMVPCLLSAMQLWATEVADYELIDLTWSTVSGFGYGPFKILDGIGLMTPYHLVSSFPGADDPSTPNGKVIVKLKEMIDANKLGVQTKQGFYTYE